MVAKSWLKMGKTSALVIFGILIVASIISPILIFVSGFLVAAANPEPVKLDQVEFDLNNVTLTATIRFPISLNNVGYFAIAQTTFNITLANATTQYNFNGSLPRIQAGDYFNTTINITYTFNDLAEAFTFAGFLANYLGWMEFRLFSRMILVENLFFTEIALSGKIEGGFF